MGKPKLTSKAKNKAEDDNQGMSNAHIVQTVMDMVDQIVFIREDNGKALRVVGEYEGDDFNPHISEVVMLQEVPFAINNLLKKAEFHLIEERDKVVQGLYILLKARSLVNVGPGCDPSSSRLSIRLGTTLST